MNRDIKFRAWDKERKEMRQVQLMDWSDWWVSTDTGHTWERENALEYGERNSFKNEETDRHILMQYTGLKDKNGKEIYEGDIVEHRSIGGIDKGPWIGEVTIHPTQGVKVGVWPISFDYEVIGNIYEHPHLLEDKQ